MDEEYELQYEACAGGGESGPEVWIKIHGFRSEHHANEYAEDFDRYGIVVFQDFTISFQPE